MFVKKFLKEVCCISIVCTCLANAGKPLSQDQDCEFRIRRLSSNVLSVQLPDREFNISGILFAQFVLFPGKGQFVPKPDNQEFNQILQSVGQCRLKKGMLEYLLHEEEEIAESDLFEAGRTAQPPEGEKLMSDNTTVYPTAGEGPPTGTDRGVTTEMPSVQVSCREGDDLFAQWSDANARVTKLVDTISCLEVNGGLKSSILQQMAAFIGYYDSSSEVIKQIVKENTDLIDCLGVIACSVRDIVPAQPEEKQLADFFKKITDMPMTALNGKQILEKSDGELAYDFKSSGGLNGVE